MDTILRRVCDGRRSEFLSFDIKILLLSVLRSVLLTIRVMISVLDSFLNLIFCLFIVGFHEDMRMMAASLVKFLLSFSMPYIIIVIKWVAPEIH